MQRIKLLILVIAVSSILLGAGYASWNETLNLDTYAETGIFCVKIGGVKGESIDGLSDVKIIDAIINKESQNKEGQTVDFRIENLYPGAEAKYTITFKNLGTVDAALSEIKTDIDSSDSIADEIEISLDGEDFHDYKDFDQDVLGQGEEGKTIVDKESSLEMPFYIRMKENTEADFNHHTKHGTSLNMSFTWVQKNLK